MRAAEAADAPTGPSGPTRYTTSQVPPVSSETARLERSHTTAYQTIPSPMITIPIQSFDQDVQNTTSEDTTKATGAITVMPRSRVSPRVRPEARNAISDTAPIWKVNAAIEPVTEMIECQLGSGSR